MADNCEPVANPKRIVSLSPSCTEILFAVGAGTRVVGVTDYCNYPDEVEARVESGDTVRVGGYWNPSIKSVLGLKPDLVLVSTAQCTVKTNKCKTNCSRKCELTVQAAKKLENCGITVLTLAPHSLGDVLDDILSVGKATGNVAEACSLVGNLKQRIELVAAESKMASHKPKVYFEVWNDPYMSVNSGTWIGDLIKLAGGVNVFGEAVSEWPITTSEDMIRRNPDVMVFPVVPDVPPFWGSFEAVKKRHGWSNITAVRNGCLYMLPRDCISRPGPRLVESLEMLEQMIRASS